MADRNRFTNGDRLLIIARLQKALFEFQNFGRSKLANPAVALDSHKPAFTATNTSVTRHRTLVVGDLTSATSANSHTVETGFEQLAVRKVRVNLQARSVVAFKHFRFNLVSRSTVVVGSAEDGGLHDLSLIG